MHHYLFPLIFITLIYVAMIVMNERYRLFSADHFSSTTTKVIAYVWLGVLMLGLVILITGASLRIPTAEQMARTPFYQLFGLHAILVIFLVVWWLLTKRPPI